MAPNTRADSNKRDNTTPSCSVCNRRKVKCDRVYPCAPCKKTGLECTFPEPARKRPRRKPSTPPAEDSTGAAGEKSPTEKRPTDRIDGGTNARTGARRVFGGIGYEFGDGGNAAALASDSTPSTVAHAPDHQFDLNFDQQPVSYQGYLFISPADVNKLGQAYRTHVDPIVKVFHWNTALTGIIETQEAIVDGVELDLSDSSDHCLFRAICFMTAIATDGAVLEGYSDDRGRSLVQRCRIDAELALSEVQFMKVKDFRILQALVLYLLALQSLREDETVWMLLAIAIRIASTLGLPQDVGEGALNNDSPPPYQIEMMRRLWWAILALDARVTRILGRTGYLQHNFEDIPRPANVDDHALFPEMDTMPPDMLGLADAAYIRYRATLSDVLPFIYASGNKRDKSGGLIQMIDDAERQIEEEFIQYCDDSVPIHLLTFIAGRGYVMRVKLALYSISPSTDDPAVQMPYAPEAFWLAKDSMEMFLILWTEPGMKPWQWHWKDFFGWHTLRVFVQEIAKRSSCSKVIDAWKLVKRAAGLVVSACKLGPEKARLVGDLRMLIEAGDVRPRTPGDSYAYATGSMVQSIRPGMGTNPHNAMFPGMAASFTISPAGEEGDPNARDPVTDEFDLNKVNWSEIDRVLLQLGTYSGG